MSYEKASRALSVLALAIAALLTAGDARADEAPETPELRALVDEVDREAAALATNDCTLACRSLDSMRKTVDRLCALDPGTRCERARSKLGDASKRVETACPSCPETPRLAAKPAPAPEAAPDKFGREAPAEPQAVASKKGGCAACAVGSGPRSDAGLWLLLALTVLAARRRRRLP